MDSQHVARDAAVGTKKRGYERDEERPDVVWEKRRKCNFWEDDAVDSTTAMAAVGTKRSYEPDEVESDVISVKRFKCNYWEDPAYAELEECSSRLAQMAALDNDHERSRQENRAWNAAQ
jgi:hypothetical protein